MLMEERKNERPVFCVMDTSALFGYPDQVEMLGRTLARKEFDGKKGVYGKIVILEVVRREVIKYYSKLSKQREKTLLKQLFLMRSWVQVKTLFRERRKRKQFSENVKKAKALLDRELKNNKIWMFKREDSEIMRILMMLQTKPGVYKKIWGKGEQVENPAGDSDLIILATAMQLSVSGIVFVVTRDSGLANATIYVNKELGYRRVIVKRNALGPWFKGVA